MKPYLVLVNQSSRGGKARKLARRYAELLPEGEFVTLTDIGEATRLAADAEGRTAVVACGGDGTLRAVAEGVLANPDPARRFGVLYAGTSPDFCRDHSIPTNPIQAVETLRGGAVAEIPILTANGCPFLCSANFGIGAVVAETANRLRPCLGDALGTLAAVMREIFKAKPYDLAVDGETIPNLVHALVTRTPSVAGGMKLVLPPIADDEFALWTIRATGRFWWAKALWRLFRGKPCGEVRILRSTATVTSPVPMGLEFDGDPHGSLPVAISFHPRRLRLIVPADGRIGVGGHEIDVS